MASITDVLLVKVKKLIFDLRSDKAKVRKQSLDDLHNIFDNRSTELCVTLKANENDDPETFTWSQLFTGLHEAIKDQCMRIERSVRTQNALITKNNCSMFKEALRRCVNIANEHIPNVSYRIICNTALECFETPALCMYFGDLYLQIIRKHILNAKHSLDDIQITDWNRKSQNFIFM